MWALASVGAATLFLSRHDGANAVFETPLQNFAGAQYVCNITVAGQRIAVIPDTGSFGLLLTSSRCATCTQQAFNASEAEERDTGYTTGAAETDVSFGSGAAEISLAHADVAVGPARANMPIWEITDTDAAMQKMWGIAHFGGILGLGWPDLDPNNQSTVLAELGVEKFAFCFGAGLRGEASMFFGTAVPEREQVYAPVIGEHHWGVALQGVRAEGGGPVLCGEEQCAALVDSGTSQLLIPPQHAQVLKAMLAVDSHCANYATLPDLVLTLGGHEVRITKKAYVKRLVLGGIDHVVGRELTTNGTGYRLVTERSPRKEFCWLDISANMMVSDHGPVWILGMSFFREHFVSFDRERRRVGIGGPCHPDDGPDLCEDCEAEAALMRREVVVSPGLRVSL